MNFTKVREDLLELPEPELYLHGELNHGVYEFVAMGLAQLRLRKSPDIAVTIDSGGGPLLSGLDIYDLLRNYKGKKTATVTNRAASIAAVVLQACDVRQCSRHSSILIHHVSRSSVSLDELTSPARLKKVFSQLERDQGRLYAILASRTGQRIATIRRVCREDRFMTSEEALEFGLIDTIV